MVGKVFTSQSPFEGLLRNKSLGLIRIFLKPYLLGKHKEKEYARAKTSVNVIQTSQAD